MALRPVPELPHIKQRTVKRPAPVAPRLHPGRRGAEATQVNYRSKANFARLRTATAMGVALSLLVLGETPALAAGASRPGQPFADQAAMANAVNAYTNEMANYAENGFFTADGPSLDPSIPWSKTVRPGHVNSVMIPHP